VTSVFDFVKAQDFVFLKSVFLVKVEVNFEVNLIMIRGITYESSTVSKKDLQELQSGQAKRCYSRDL
jgi:hypothetical protein